MSRFSQQKLSQSRKHFLLVVCLWSSMFLTTATTFAQTITPGTSQISNVGTTQPLSPGAITTQSTVPNKPYDNSVGLTTYVQQAAEQNEQGVITNVSNVLTQGSDLGQPNDVYQGISKFYSQDIVGNLFRNIGQIIGQWLVQLITGPVADTVKFLSAVLRTFVLNPNIAVNSTGSSINDQVSQLVRQGGNVMYAVACDILLLLFILSIWRYWTDAALNGKANLMSAVGRLIFTSGIMLAWPSIYAMEIQITNEMIQAINFNSMESMAMFDSAMSSAVKAGITGGLGLLARAIVPVLSSGAGLDSVVGEAAMSTVGGVVTAVGVIVFIVLGGIIIAQLLYMIILKATQSAILIAQYMFAPMFLVCFASPDTERIATGYVRSFIEVSLWTFVWVGLLRILVILMWSDFNPWGKIIVAIGVLQLMVKTPEFLAKAQISPISDYVSAGVLTGGMVKFAGSAGHYIQNKAFQLAKHQLHDKHNLNESSRVTINVPNSVNAPAALQRMMENAGADPVTPPPGQGGASPPSQGGASPAITTPGGTSAGAPQLAPGARGATAAGSAGSAGSTVTTTATATTTSNQTSPPVSTGGGTLAPSGQGHAGPPPPAAAPLSTESEPTIYTDPTGSPPGAVNVTGSTSSTGTTPATGTPNAPSTHSNAGSPAVTPAGAAPVTSTPPPSTGAAGGATGAGSATGSGSGTGTGTGTGTTAGAGSPTLHTNPATGNPAGVGATVTVPPATPSTTPGTPESPGLSASLPPNASPMLPKAGGRIANQAISYSGNNYRNDPIRMLADKLWKGLTKMSPNLSSGDSNFYSRVGSDGNVESLNYAQGAPDVRQGLLAAIGAQMGIAQNDPGLRDTINRASRARGVQIPGFWNKVAAGVYRGGGGSLESTNLYRNQDQQQRHQILADGAAAYVGMVPGNEVADYLSRKWFGPFDPDSQAYNVLLASTATLDSGWNERTLLAEQDTYRNGFMGSALIRATGAQNEYLGANKEGKQKAAGGISSLMWSIANDIESERGERYTWQERDALYTSIANNLTRPEKMAAASLFAAGATEGESMQLAGNRGLVASTARLGMDKGDTRKSYDEAALSLTSMQAATERAHAAGGFSQLGNPALHTLIGNSENVIRDARRAGIKDEDLANPAVADAILATWLDRGNSPTILQAAAVAARELSPAQYSQNRHLVEQMIHNGIPAQSIKKEDILAARSLVDGGLSPNQLTRKGIDDRKAEFAPLTHGAPFSAWANNAPGGGLQPGPPSMTT